MTDASQITHGADVPTDWTAPNANLGTKVNELADRVTTAEDDKVKGPSSATDNRVCKFDGTTGKLIQVSGLTISNVNELSGGSLADAMVDEGNVTQHEAALTLTASTVKYRKSKSVTIKDPSSSEDVSIFFTNKAITITEMRAVLIRGKNEDVTWTIRHATSREAAGAEVVTSGTTTSNNTTGDDITTFNDATIPADSHVWLETTALTGTPIELHVTIFFDED